MDMDVLGMTTGLTSNIIVVAFWFLLGILLCGGIGVGIYFLLMYIKYSKFICYIFENDEHGNIFCKKDSAGTFKTAKFGYGFYLRKSKVRMDPADVPFINLPSKLSIKKLCFIKKQGENYTFLHGKLTENNISFEVTEQDLNWGIDALKEGDKLISGVPIWPQIVAFMIIAIPTLFILVLFVFLFQKIETIAEIMAPAIQQSLAGQIIP